MIIFKIIMKAYSEHLSDHPLTKSFKVQHLHLSLCSCGFQAVLLLPQLLYQFAESNRTKARMTPKRTVTHTQRPIHTCSSSRPTQGKRPPLLALITPSLISASTPAPPSCYSQAGQLPQNRASSWSGLRPALPSAHNTMPSQSHVTHSPPKLCSGSPFWVYVKAPPSSSQHFNPPFPCSMFSLSIALTF